MNARHTSSGPVIRAGRPLLAALALTMLAGCTTLGGHVSGDFACRAPQGNCAPASVIDAQALGTLSGDADRPIALTGHRGSVRAEPGDLRRTSERKLRIVFPAHVDASGIFHEEAVVWAIAEPADWAARARAPEAAPGLRGIGKAIAERLEAPASNAPEPDGPIPAEVDTPTHDDLFLPLASPPDSPFTAREATAGAHAPAIEGFDTTRTRDRTPRSGLDPLIVWPSIEAIEEARLTATAPPAIATTSDAPLASGTPRSKPAPQGDDSATPGAQPAPPKTNSADAAQEPKP